MPQPKPTQPESTYKYRLTYVTQNGFEAAKQGRSVPPADVVGQRLYNSYDGEKWNLIGERTEQGWTTVQRDPGLIVDGHDFT